MISLHAENQNRNNQVWDKEIMRTLILLTLMLAVWESMGWAAPGVMPELRFEETPQETVVYCADELLVQFKEHKRVRFRGTIENDHWIGTEASPADISWEYLYPLVYVHDGAEYVETADGFVLTMTGRKPLVDATIRTTLQATWNPSQGSFVYLLGSELHCSLDKWYEHVPRSGRVYQRFPEKSATIEPLDFHINRISVPDLMQCGIDDGRVIYRGFVIPKETDEWLLLPKLHLPNIATRPGEHPADLSRHPIDKGGRFGFVDEKEGGWMLQFVDIPVPATLGPCWMFQDIHVFLPDAVPPRHSQERFDCRYQINFSELTAAQCRDILAQSRPVSWRAAPEYQLPVFSRHNTFTRCANEGEYMWFASSYACRLDNQIGYDDKASAAIEQDQGYAAWYGRCWGYGFDTAELTGGKRYRITAQVKTEDCLGVVRLAGVIITRKEQPDIWFARGRLPSQRPAEWTFSDALGGTNEWRELSVVVQRQNFDLNGKVLDVGLIVLEQIGPGRCWFDNVVIEEIGFQ